MRNQLAQELDGTLQYLFRSARPDQRQGEADEVINAMYGSSTARNVHTGLDYVCLRDEFYSTKPIRIRKDVTNLLVLFGGTDGQQHGLWIRRGDEKLPLRTMDTQYVRPGDVIVTKSGGGGGIGSPLDRDAEKVRRDVLDRYISPEKAREVYGVVLEGEAFGLDAGATQKLREERKRRGDAGKG